MAGAVTLDQLTAWITIFRDRVTAEQDSLTALDSAIGDADHGSNMARGLAAAADACAGRSTAAELGKAVGMALVSTVGGASGPLYGTFFLRWAGAAGAVDSMNATQLAAALRAGLGGVIDRGKAEPGDKTMLDALLPALDAWEAAGDDVTASATAAATAAAQGRDATAPLQARKGRASYLGERSIGHIDPGSASTAIMFAALAEALA